MWSDFFFPTKVACSRVLMQLLPPWELGCWVCQLENLYHIFFLISFHLQNSLSTWKHLLPLKWCWGHRKPCPPRVQCHVACGRTQALVRSWYFRCTEKKKMDLLKWPRSYFGNKHSHLLSIPPPIKSIVDSDDSRANGLSHSSCPNLMEGPSHRVFVAWGQPWKQAQEGLTLVVKCFSLEVTHLSCAYSPLADGPWPTWWWGEGRGIREGPRVRCGWHQKYLPEAHSEMTFPGSCGYAGTLTGWTPGLPNSKTHTPPTTTYSATKCSLANKTPLRTQVAVE